MPGPGWGLRRRQRTDTAWWRGSPEHHNDGVRLDVLSGQSIQKTEGSSPWREDFTEKMEFIWALKTGENFPSGGFHVHKGTESGCLLLGSLKWPA